MKLILFLLKCVAVKRTHDDNLRASEGNPYHTINGYAVMCKVHRK